MKQLETSFVLCWMSLLPSNTSAHSSHVYRGQSHELAHEEPNSSARHELALGALFRKIILKANSAGKGTAELRKCATNRRPPSRGNEARERGNLIL